MAPPSPPPQLVQAASLNAFLAAPAGAYLVGRTFIYFEADAKVTGYVLWGSPDATDVDLLERLMSTSNLRLGPHTSLVDARAVAGVPTVIFNRLAAFVRANRETLRVSLTKVAVVHGTGIAGAITSGFFSVVDPPYPVRNFHALSDALAWLGAGAPGELAAELERIRDGSSTVPAIVRQIRALAAEALPEPDEEAIARAMATSRRTLQRRLADAGTTFATEVARARVERAIELLETTEMPFTRIGIEVGSPSLSSFSALVKKLTGMTPTEIRQRSLQVAADRGPATGGAGAIAPDASDEGTPDLGVE